MGMSGLNLGAPQKGCGHSSVVEHLSSMNETRSLFFRSVKAEEGEEEADSLKTAE